jgi:hypothetical protein
MDERHPFIFDVNHLIVSYKTDEYSIAILSDNIFAIYMT